jgi:hypothetical protein
MTKVKIVRPDGVQIEIEAENPEDAKKVLDAIPPFVPAVVVNPAPYPVTYPPLQPYVTPGTGTPIIPWWSITWTC